MSLVVSKNRPGRTYPALMDDFFNMSPIFGQSLLDFTGGGFLRGHDSPFVPNANIVENEKDYQIELAVPGFDRKDFKVEVEDDMLIVSTEKEEERQSEERNYRSREFTYSSFYRSFNLPKGVMWDKIDAKYTNGVLNITLPKKEEFISKHVKQIKVA